MTTPSYEEMLMPVFTAAQAVELVAAFQRIHTIIGTSPALATLGDDIITNGSFTTGLGSWTFTGWTYSAPTAVHTVGNTSALSQTISVTNGTHYLIQSTIVGADPIAGISNIYVDGTLCPGYNTVETTVSGTNYVSYTATATGDVLFEIRPSADFVSAYSAISMKPITAYATSTLSLYAYGEVPEFLGMRGTRTSGNLGLGGDALIRTSTGANNVAVGKRALINNISGFENIAIGTSTLEGNNVGYGNIALGYNTLFSNTGGFQNTAIGGNALTSNTYGTYNTAVGSSAMTDNVTGISNVAIGVNAGYTITGNYNVAIGSNAIGAANPNTGTHNNAVGIDCMRAITSGKYNEAMGYEAMFKSSTAQGCDVLGHQALRENTTGNYNVAIGYQTLTNLASGSNNVALGASAGDAQTAGSNNIIIGYNVDAPSTTGSNQLNIGNTIYGDLANDKIGVGMVPNSKFAVSGIPVYANNAAALAGGLLAGDFYRTGADPDPLCVVH